MVSFFGLLSIRYKITTAGGGAFPLRHAGEQGSGKWPERAAVGRPGHGRAQGGTIGKPSSEKEMTLVCWCTAGTQEKGSGQSPGPLPALGRVFTGPGRHQVHIKSIKVWT
ncbi:hypothetical protein HRH25_21245 [Flavisolibacter sp. BT320]|nr:hypothetical protein [Flavisolibacter longurius]